MCFTAGLCTYTNCQYSRFTDSQKILKTWKRKGWFILSPLLQEYKAYPFFTPPPLPQRTLLILWKIFVLANIHRHSLPFKNTKVLGTPSPLYSFYSCDSDAKRVYLWLCEEGGGEDWLVGWLVFKRNHFQLGWEILHIVQGWVMWLLHVG